MMSLNNAGGSISTLWGGKLLNALHIVKIPKNETLAASLTSIGDLPEDQLTYDFTNLLTALWIRIGLMIVPAFLALCMIPDSSHIKGRDEEEALEMDGRGEFAPIWDEDMDQEDWQTFE